MRKRKHVSNRTGRKNPYRRTKLTRRKTFTLIGMGMVALMALSLAIAGGFRSGAPLSGKTQASTQPEAPPKTKAN
jgi:hypothetical protein